MATKPMTMTQALAKAKKLWGRLGQPHVQEQTNAPTASERKAARAVIDRWVADKASVPRDELQKARGVCTTFRCSVGYVPNVSPIPWFMVQGQGDTWEEAFEQAEQRRIKEGTIAS